jgi:plasmid stabilization system protein ParE
MRLRYRVEVTHNAEREAQEAFEWLRARTPQHAPLWLEGLIRAWESLSDFPHRCPRAREADDVREDVRQLLYGKRKGIYRILFTVRDDVVYILHVRHGARQKMSGSEIQFPPGFRA